MVPKLLRSLLLHLENIKQVMAEKFNKIIKAKGKAAAHPEANSNLKRKVSEAQVSKSLIRHTFRNMASIARLTAVPTRRTILVTIIAMATHNTLDYHHYDSNGKPLSAATGEPSDTKKPY
jgi:hypothetical protein